MAEIQQQIADGARPLARVGDVIEHGEPIPPNVVRMTGSYALNTPATITRVIETGLSRYWTGGRMQTWDDLSTTDVAGKATCDTCRAQADEDAVAHQRGKPADSGPLVLALPVVPDGTVALITADGTRFAAKGPGWWQSDHRGTMSFARLLAEGAPLTVEMAPPREPRTWPKLDGPPEIDDLPAVVDLIEPERSPLRFVRTTGLRGVPRYIEPGHPECSFTLDELRQLGEVREVLDGQ